MIMSFSSNARRVFWNGRGPQLDEMPGIACEGEYARGSAETNLVGHCLLRVRNLIAVVLHPLHPPLQSKRKRRKSPMDLR